MEKIKEKTKALLTNEYLERQLQEKIAKEFSLPINDNSFMLIENSNEVVEDEKFDYFDKWMNDLINRNGTTDY